ncbi:MAG: response regulator transcription factor [Sphingobacterium sp.]|jgi:DNA-binding NarL/FixJ family response regulator|nr:response regulator transcription factor [Sphingobacterium sp.]
MKYKIAVVDDHPIVIEGIVNILSQMPDIVIAGCFITGSDFLAFAKGHVIDVVLLDIILPDMNGIDLCYQIKQATRDIKVLVLSNHAEKSAIIQMLQHGANGYILKNASSKELKGCIHLVLQGQMAFGRGIQEIMSNSEPHNQRSITTLSFREKEVLKLLAEGFTTSQIAKKLFISPFTVENHRKNILHKTGVSNVAALIAVAAKMGYL